MRVGFRASLHSFSLPLLFSCLLLVGAVGLAQAPQSAAQPAAGAEAERSVSLPESGHCTEALPLLRESIRQTANRDLKERIGLDGATKLDAGFPEVYLGLGTSLNSAKRFTFAIPALETDENMVQDSPTGHSQLAFAYAGVGRPDDANWEAALQRQTAEALEAVRRKAATALEKPQAPDSQALEQK